MKRRVVAILGNGRLVNAEEAEALRLQRVRKVVGDVLRLHERDEFVGGIVPQVPQGGAEDERHGRELGSWMR